MCGVCESPWVDPCNVPSPASSPWVDPCDGPSPVSSPRGLPLAANCQQTGGLDKQTGHRDAKTAQAAQTAQTAQKAANLFCSCRDLRQNKLYKSLQTRRASPIVAFHSFLV